MYHYYEFQILFTIMLFIPAQLFTYSNITYFIIHSDASILTGILNSFESYVKYQRRHSSAVTSHCTLRLCIIRSHYLPILTLGNQPANSYTLELNALHSCAHVCIQHVIVFVENTAYGRRLGSKHWHAVRYVHTISLLQKRLQVGKTVKISISVYNYMDMDARPPLRTVNFVSSMTTTGCAVEFRAPTNTAGGRFDDIQKPVYPIIMMYLVLIFLLRSPLRCQQLTVNFRKTYGRAVNWY